MTHLDLFSGIGGFALAARWAGLETIQFVEIEKFAQQVLTKNFPGIPIHDNIKTFSATGIVSPFLLTGGYPCQPFSQAGKRRGEEDDRHLWPEMFRVIRECRPTWILAENVSGHIKLGLEEVLTDLEGEGYDSQVFHIGALAKDAPHRRMRLWIVAHSISTTSRGGTIIGETGNERGEDSRTEPESVQSGNRAARSDNLKSCSEDVANSNSQRLSEGANIGGKIPKEIRGAEYNLRDSTSSEDVGNSNNARCSEQRREGSIQEEQFTAECGGWWLPEPSVGRVAHGIPSRVDRLKGLGNAIVPQVAYEIIRHMKP